VLGSQFSGHVSRSTSVPSIVASRAADGVLDQPFSDR
jgi:hypothetical protein